MRTFPSTLSARLRRLAAAALALACAALPAPAAAQQGAGTITGQVTDRGNGRPLPDVNVVIVGTTRGARTGENGQYRITGVPAGAAQVRATRLGYAAGSATVQVTAGGEANANFQLNPAAVQIDAVTVTATGQTERRRESGATIATIDSSTFVEAAVTNISQTLAAKAPGVSVAGATGTTGTSSRIRIRGSNSISLNNDPLLIVDGVRVNNSTGSTAIGVGGQVPSRFEDFSPDEIESIDIIKGPAAAALYGTAAANGVIQITTKKGRAGKTRWDVFAEAGTIADVNKYPLNYAAFGHTPSGGLVANCISDYVARKLCSVDSLVTNDPVRNTGVVRDGSRRTAGVSVTGGSQQTTFFMATELQREQGVYDINQLRRLNIRTNLRSQLTRTFDLTASLGYVNSDLRLPQNDNNALGAISGALLGKGYDCGPSRSYPALCGSDTTSRGYYTGFTPQYFYPINTRQNLNRVTGSLIGNWQALSWLTFNGTLGGDISNRFDHETLQPATVNYSSTYTEGWRSNYRADIRAYTANGTGTATFNLTPALRSTTSAGVQFSQDRFLRTDAFGAKLLANTYTLNGTNARFSVGESYTDNKLVGLLAREQLAWRDRLFVTAAVRTDRSSAFGQNFGTIVQPAVNASWVVSEEDFFPKFDALSTLRLRAGYGVSSQRPGVLDPIQYFSPVAVNVGGVDVPGFTIGNIGNPDLKPERSGELEMGFDLGLLDERLSLEYTHYAKKTTDALVSVPLAPSLGSSASQFRNLGRVSNWGDELSVRAGILRGGQVEFDLNANATRQRNRLDVLGVDVNGNPLPPIYIGFSTSGQRVQEGYPLGGYFHVPYTWADKNNDGVITRVNCPGGPKVTGGPECEVVFGDTASAAQYMGSPFPKYEFNLSPVLRLGSWFQVQALVDHRGGMQLFNSTREFRCGTMLNCQEINAPTSVSLEKQAQVAALLLGNRRGMMEDATFTKLREVAVTLRLPERFARQARAAGANLTFAGRNLHTWTNYTGLDPEVNALPNSNYSAADFLTQPQVRTFVTRLTLSF